MSREQRIDLLRSAKLVLLSDEKAPSFELVLEQ